MVRPRWGQGLGQASRGQLGGGTADASAATRACAAAQAGMAAAAQPPPPSAFLNTAGRHHTKAMLLRYPAGLRLIIHGGNIGACSSSGTGAAGWHLPAALAAPSSQTGLLCAARVACKPSEPLCHCPQCPRRRAALWMRCAGRCGCEPGCCAVWGAPGQRASRAGHRVQRSDPRPAPCCPQDFPLLPPEHLAELAARSRTELCRPPCRFGSTLFDFVDVRARAISSCFPVQRGRGERSAEARPRSVPFAAAVLALHPPCADHPGRPAASEGKECHHALAGRPRLHAPPLRPAALGARLPPRCGGPRAEAGSMRVGVGCPKPQPPPPTCPQAPGCALPASWRCGGCWQLKPSQPSSAAPPSLRFRPRSTISTPS